MEFWQGTFSKIQSMFTNFLSPNSLEKKQNLRLQRKYTHLLPPNCYFQGVYLENSSLYLCKRSFLKKVRGLIEIFINCFRFSSHLIAIGNTKIKRGKKNFFSFITTHQVPHFRTSLRNIYKKSLHLIALAKVKFVGSFQKISLIQKPWKRQNRTPIF